MRPSKKLPLDQRNFLDEYDIKYDNITVNEDGSIDVNQHIKIIDLVLPAIPIKFGKVTGSFGVSSAHVLSLFNFPNEVTGSVDIYLPGLLSTKYLTPIIGENLDIQCRKLERLEHEICRVGHVLDINWHCSDSIGTISQKFVGVKHLYIKLNGKVGVLGILKLPDLQSVNIRQHANIEEIISEQIGMGNVGILNAQKNLIEEGYEEYAHFL